MDIQGGGFRAFYKTQEWVQKKNKKRKEEKEDFLSLRPGPQAQCAPDLYGTLRLGEGQV